MATMEYIQFTYGGTSYNINRPTELNLKMDDVYAGEYTTCTGRTIADRIGWKFSDLTIEWDALPQDQMTVLAQMPQTASMTFKGPDGVTYTEDIIRTSFVGFEHRWTHGGVVLWKSVKLEVSFLNVHN